VRFLGAGPSRPPRRSLWAQVRAANRSAEAAWLVLPQSLDGPLAGRLVDVRSLELRQDVTGELYVKAHGRPTAVFFRVAPDDVLSLAQWEFVSHGEATTTELWVASTVAVADLGALESLLQPAQPLAPPAPLPDGPALLRRFELPPRTTVDVVRSEAHAVRLEDPPD
jgi:hypothetical protein